MGHRQKKHYSVKLCGANVIQIFRSWFHKTKRAVASVQASYTLEFRRIYVSFTSVKAFSVNMLISISPFCVRVFVYVIHLANLRVYSTCCADIETLQLLDELLLNSGWFPDESPQHKQWQNYPIFCKTLKTDGPRPQRSWEKCPRSNRVALLFAGVWAGSLPHRELLQRPGRGCHLAVQKLQPEEQQQWPRIR